MSEAEKLDGLISFSLAAAQFISLAPMEGGEVPVSLLAQMPGSQWIPTNPVAFFGEGMEDLTKLKQFNGPPPRMVYKKTPNYSKKPAA
jgi:hypothetical protein